MSFHSLDFVAFFLLVVSAYWCLPHRAQNLLLLVSSYTFYGWIHPWFLSLMAISTVIDWASALAMTRWPGQKRAWLGLSLVTNLGMLAFFKYFNFFVENVNAAVVALGGPALRPGLDIVLPVGISFYTFESLSYCIDVFRRKCPPADTPLSLLFFITFFPKLVAGPIARPSELLPQLERPPALDRARASEGVFLIASGLVKKVALADYLSVNLVDRIFDDPESYTATEVVVALYGFTLQIYCDFSGYTDIARGSAKLFGIELPENFDRPYQSRSPAEFWRRWHMTLSTWLRDYLYFPLGGSRLGPVRTYFNLWLTIFLIGLWHGASWTFVIYGAIQGTAVALHRLVSRMRGKSDDDLARDPAWLRVAKVVGTLQFVVFSRILFRATSLENAADVLARLGSRTWSAANVAPTVWAVLLAGFALHYTPRAWRALLRARFSALPAPAQGVVMATTLALLSLVATSETVPYIYFQF